MSKPLPSRSDRRPRHEIVGQAPFWTFDDASFLMVYLLGASEPSFEIDFLRLGKQPRAFLLYAHFLSRSTSFPETKKQALSQDLLRTTLEIPFSVPPYMSLLARSIATLEGIALLGDPNYQMVAQAYPFVVRKVLRNSTASVGTLLRDIVFDASTGAVKPTRLSALLNAALGFVAERTDGFVDLDAVPEDGASLQVS
jgi:hypothetical protein